ncbi:MAG: hypothetical protein WCI72_03655 [archaeon]
MEWMSIRKEGLFLNHSKLSVWSKKSDSGRFASLLALPTLKLNKAIWRVW